MTEYFISVVNTASIVQGVWLDFFLFQSLSRNDTADSDLPAASLFLILPPLTNELIPGSRVK